MDVHQLIIDFIKNIFANQKTNLWMRLRMWSIPNQPTNNIILEMPQRWLWECPEKALEAIDWSRNVGVDQCLYNDRQAPVMVGSLSVDWDADKLPNWNDFGAKPSYIIQTSSHYQFGYFFKYLVPQQELQPYKIDMCAKWEQIDWHSRSMWHVYRLPWGKNIHKGKIVDIKLVDYKPQLKYDPYELVKMLGLKPVQGNLSGLGYMPLWKFERIEG